MENKSDRLVGPIREFQPKVTGLWNFRFMDSGTGSTVYKASSLLGERAVKFFNLEGSEKIDKLQVQNYRKRVQKVSRWLNDIRQDLREETFKDGGNGKFVWKVNPILAVGVQTYNNKEIPFSVSPWINGYPLSDIFDGKVFPETFQNFNKPNFLRWLAERVDLKRRQNRMTNPYLSIQEFIPIYRNILLTLGENEEHKLVVVDVVDYMNPKSNPIKRLAMYRTTNR